MFVVIPGFLFQGAFISKVMAASVMLSLPIHFLIFKNGEPEDA